MADPSLGDGSKEWTPDRLKKLDHKFGDDGEFWISYDDFLRKFQTVDRTRLFDKDWQVAQIWTTLVIPWMVEYHETYFAFSLMSSGPVVLVLSQLDDRYFRGLEGQYCFELAFRLHKARREDYLVRSQRPYRMRRSVNIELDLDRGDYEVKIKITASRREQVKPIEQVIRENANSRRNKLSRLGLAYDLAHSKGRVAEPLGRNTDQESCQQEEAEATDSLAKSKTLLNRENASNSKTQPSLHGQSRAPRRQEIQRTQRDMGKPKQKARQILREPARAADGSSDKEEQFAIAPEIAETKNNDSGLEPSLISSCGQSRTSNSAMVDALDYDDERCNRNLDTGVGTYLGCSKNQTREEESPICTTSQESLDEFEKDPWNAVVVVGLRVYHIQRTPQMRT